MRARRHATFAVAVFATIAVPTRARGEAPSTLRLSWVRDDGADGCPDARVIEARTRAWLGRDPFSSTAKTSAEISVARSGNGFAARIRVRDEDGSIAGERRIVSDEPSCDTLASAVALALAVHVDPNAAFGAPSRPPVAPPAPPPPAPPPRAPEAPPPPPRASAATREASLTAGAVVVSGLLPSVAFGARTAADLSFLPRWRAVLSGMILPARETSSGQFAFGLAAAGLGACADVVRAGVVHLAPCVEIAAGEIQSEVYAFHATPPGARFWAGASAFARARWTGLAPLVVDAGAGVFVPVTRPRFVVEGHDERAFQEDVVAPAADLAVGLTFP